ncbi:MAG: hypothetical protein LKG23_00025 [Nitrospira sp.]|jgi:hypothetical protein|nr:hypothetical protein [Nitrospira sp.]
MKKRLNVSDLLDIDLGPDVSYSPPKSFYPPPTSIDQARPNRRTDFSGKMGQPSALDPRPHTRRT